MSLEFFDECRKLTEILEKYEAANITKAAKIVANGIMNGGRNKKTWEQINCRYCS